jgi:hypothetical protein
VAVAAPPLEPTVHRSVPNVLRRTLRPVRACTAVPSW